MIKRGRPSKYQKHVEPYLSEIAEMALTMTERQIATTLGVSYSAFRDYKEQYPALKKTLLQGRKELVAELKSTLISKAKGYQYKESKTTYINGVEEKKEEIVKYSHPDVAAINLLLKNYDKDNWANDPQMLKIKQEELELKKKSIENGDWE